MAARGSGMTADLMAQARAGDDRAFANLIEPYMRELQVHCYRILGSVHDAEDACQEALLSAWRGLPGFEEHASLRYWLYRVATNCCLQTLRARRRRPRAVPVAMEIEPPEPTRYGEVLWLEPYPDVLLEGLIDQAPGPEAQYEAREAISLAFVTALQLLPPRQRTVLILRDVLGFPAREVAGMLQTSEESVTSALKRARGALRDQVRPRDGVQPAPAPGSAAERATVERLARAYELGDLEAIVGLLTDDVRLTMPPLPLEYHGRASSARFLKTVSLRADRTFRLVPTRANGQPAFGFYVHGPHGDADRATGLLVLALSGDRISAMTHFDSSVLPGFGLPRMLPRGQRLQAQPPATQAAGARRRP
jgi:RNA polymerase sigma-70 factor (TIGR02960 family)